MQVPSVRKVLGLSLGLGLALAGSRLVAQGVGVDQVQVGPLALHDHVAFDYHIPIKNDPFPHEVKEGYAFDGVDLGAAIRWHWGRTRLETQLRVTPASRLHFAYDQDTDFEPNTNFTHGDEGLAHSRTFGLKQEFPLMRLGKTQLGGALGFLRQWTRYHQVTTYDLNTNPALPSTFIQRLIYERAILYELRTGLSLARQWQLGGWEVGGKLGATPLTSIFLHNYVPELAATSAIAFGGTMEVEVQRRVGSWGLDLTGRAGQYHGYRAIEGFQRQEFALQLEVAPPRFW
ncbi:MAG TPA: hypothetical protein VNF74_04865 [Terriglobales bacterium]|nr:hypothetical protein [Terriglobales bacterium]